MSSINPLEKLVPIIRESLKWKFGHPQDSTASPIIELIKKANKSSNEGWFLEKYFDGKDIKHPSSSVSFWILLIHMISSGNPNRDNVPVALGFAFGMSRQSIWRRSRRAIDFLCAKKPSDIYKSHFNKTLAFKYVSKDVGSASSIYSILLQDKKKKKGYLQDVFFPSISEAAYKVKTPEKCKVVLLFLAACCGNPRGEYVCIVSMAWGISHVTLNMLISSELPRICLPGQMIGEKRKKGNATINTILEKDTTPSKCPADNTPNIASSPFLSPEQLRRQRARYKSPAFFRSVSSVVQEYQQPLANIFTSVTTAIGLTPTKNLPLDHDTESETSRVMTPVNLPDDNTSQQSDTGLAYDDSDSSSQADPVFDLTRHVGQLSLQTSDVPRLVSPIASETAVKETSSKRETSEWVQDSTTGLLRQWKRNKVGACVCVGTAIPITKTRKQASELSSKYTKKKVKAVVDFLKISGDDDQHTLLEETAKQCGFTLESIDTLDDKKQFTVEEAYAHMSLMNITLNKMNMIDQFCRLYKGWRFYPKNFLKQLSTFEKLDRLEIQTGSLKLLTKKGDSGKSDEFKICDWFCLKQPHRVIATCVVACFMAGRFVSTNKLSYHKDSSLLVPFGCDKGGPSTNMLLRLGNRKDGNGKNFCAIVASMGSGAAECYQNLIKTIYKPGSPHARFLQDLVLDKLFAIVVYIGGRQNGAEDVFVFVFKLYKDLAVWEFTLLAEVSIPVTRGEDIPYGTSGQPANESSKVDPTNFDLDHHTTVAPSMIVHTIKSDNESSYIGFEANCGMSKRGFLFDKKISAKLPIHFECFQLLGFPSHDTKHGWLCGGQADSAMAAKSCLVCTADRFIEQKVLLQWIRKHIKKNNKLKKLLSDDPSVYNNKAEDAPLRVDEYSNIAMEKLHCKETGNGTYALSQAKTTEINRKCQGVIRKPLLYIPPTKDPMAPMHNPHGIVNHFFKNVRKQLRQLDMTTPWQQEVDQVLNDVKSVLSGNKEYNATKNKFNALTRKITQAQAALRLAQVQGMASNIVAGKKRVVIELEASRQQMSDLSNIGQWNQLRKAAAALKSGIEAAKKETSRLPRGPAEYAFNQALPLFGRASYMKHFGGGLLSHDNGMTVLEHWDDVIEAVKGSYLELDSSFQESLATIMDSSKEMARTLFKLCLLLKSQKKITAQLQEEIEEIVATVCVMWIVLYPMQEGFPKLHHLEHIPVFIALHGTYGLLSEEGFESIHPLVNKILVDLSSMMDARGRMQTMTNRIHKSLNPVVERIKMEFELKLHGRYNNRPKKYKTAGRRSRNQDDGEVEYCYFQGVSGGQYLLLEANEGIIKAYWQRVYELVCCSKAPDAWSKIFTDRDDLGDIKKEDIKFIYN